VDKRKQCVSRESNPDRFLGRETSKKKTVREPGIEPGSLPWKGNIEEENSA